MNMRLLLSCRILHQHLLFTCDPGNEDDCSCKIDDNAPWRKRR
jgi:hypothetical protein